MSRWLRRVGRPAAGWVGFDSSLERKNAREDVYLQAKNAREGRVLASLSHRGEAVYSTLAPHRRFSPSDRSSLLDVALSRAGRVGGTWIATRDEDQALELGHQDPVLVVDTRVYLDGAAIGL